MLTPNMDKAYESECAKYQRRDDGFTSTVTRAAEANKDGKNSNYKWTSR